MTQRSIVTLGVLVVLAGGGVYWARHRAPDAPAFTTSKLDKGKIIAKVTATGTLSSLVTVQVGSQISGRVAALFADYNSVVKKGQVVAKLDTALLEAAVQQSEANLAAAEGSLAKSRAQAVDAERQAKRSVALLDKKLVAQADTDTADANRLAAEAQVKADEGQLAQARANLNQARINLKYATIISPINGVVIARSVDVGQTVAAAMTAPTLFSIAEDLGKMQVDTSVAESDVGKIKANMDATFTVDAYPNEKFRGTVRQIRNAATTVQSVVTYDAVVDVANPELKLKPGMTANVSFIYDERDGVLKLPSAALRFQMPEDDGKPAPERKKGEHKGDHRGKSANDPRTVWVLRGTPPAPVSVSIHTGISDGSYVEVVDGDLKEGDDIITDSTNDSAKKSSQGMPRGPRPPM